MLFRCDTAGDSFVEVAHGGKGFATGYVRRQALTVFADEAKGGEARAMAAEAAAAREAAAAKAGQLKKPAPKPQPQRADGKEVLNNAAAWN